jgi:hypothetical protein
MHFGMTHERARFLLTITGAVVPIIAMASIFLILLFAQSHAALSGLLIILSALLIGIGHAAFIIITAVWNCGECGRRYFAYFMPYWLFDRGCQNCTLVD